MLAHAGGEGVGVAHERRAAMVVDDAFGIAGRAARIVERDRVPFVRRHRPGKGGIAGIDEGFVIDATDGRAFDPALEVGIIDDERLDLGETERGFEGCGEFGVGDENLGFRMLEHEGDRRRVEAGVDGMEHGANHRHAVMGLEHCGRIGEHHRDGIALADAAASKSRG